MSVKIEDGGTTTKLTILSGGVLNFVTLKVNSVSQLRNKTGVTDGQVIDLLGYYEKGDGGGGTLYWDSTSTDDDNGVSVFKVSGVDTGRWIRNISGPISILAGGAKSDGSDVTDAVQKTNDVGTTWIPEGIFCITNITVSNDILGVGTLKITSDSDNAIELNSFSSLKWINVIYEGQSTNARNIVYSNSDFVTLDSVSIEVTNTTLPNKATACELEGVKFFSISDSKFYGPYIDSTSYLSSGDLGYGVLIRNSRGSITSIDSSGFLDGLKVSLSGSLTESYLSVVSSHFRKNARDGVDAYVMSGGNLNISSCHFTENQDLIADFKVIGDVEDSLEDNYDVIFVNNHCYNNNLDRAGVSFAENKNVKCHGNTIDGSRFGFSSLRAGCDIYDNTIRNTQNYGVQFIQGERINNSVSRNVFENIGLGGSTDLDRSAIVLNDTENCTVENNTFYRDDPSTSTMIDIRFEGTSLKNIVRYNKTDRNGIIISNLDDWKTNYVYNNTNLTQEQKGNQRFDNVENRQEFYDGNTWGKILDENNDFWEFSGDVLDDEFLEVTQGGIAGFGKVIVGDNEEYGEFRFDGNGNNIVLINNTANFSSGDVGDGGLDGTFAIYTPPGNDKIQLRNRLGATKKIKALIWLQK